MRHLHSFFCSLILFSSVALMPWRADASPVYGDVNGSEDVNIADVISLIDHMLNGETTIRDDVDGNIEVNIADATCLIDYLLGGELKFDLYYPPVPDSALVITVKGVSFAMMPVQGGSFYPHYSSASPSTLNDYYVGMTEVTMELWEAVMGSRPISAMRYKAKPNQPVDCPTWWECKDFIAKLNELTGLEFHMPTHDQWEYAAMGGHLTHGYIYSGSEDIDEVGWYDGNRPAIFERYYQNWANSYTLPVGMKKPNELGIYDMTGNVREWLEASSPGWGEYYRTLNPEDNNTFCTDLIGGSNRQIASECTIYSRMWTLTPNTTATDAGFRLALQASSLNR